MSLTLAFDGDDTLWHNENLFKLTQQAFRQRVLSHVMDADVDGRLLETEVRNLRLFGYGVKGFTLSMIETAIELTDRRIPASDIEAIIELAKAMLDHPVELLDGAADTIRALAARHRVLLITKGDLFDQESKIARSGLAEYFQRIEIVSEKDPATYQRILDAEEIQPDDFLMVGNSLRSDILPVLELGGRAVHIPYHTTWGHEVVELPIGLPTGGWVLENIGQLPGLLEQIAS